MSCLLAGKTVGHYRQIIQKLKNAVRFVTGHALKPKRVVCDFEIAIKSAIETELPRTKVCGCLFHFRQSLYRKLNELGLSGASKQDGDFQATIAKVMSIGFLSLHHVRNNFNLWATSQSFLRLARQYPDLNQFVAYVYNTYIIGRFPPAMWNVYMRRAGTRTNNNVEGNRNFKLYIDVERSLISQ